MLFPTLSFFLFFMAVFPLGIVCKRYVGIYKLFLVGINIVFYSFWGWHFAYILLGSVGVNYLFNHLIWTSPPAKRLKTTYLVIALGLNLGFLAVCKYHSFFVDALLAMFNNWHLPFEVELLRITAPIGISFYTFRQIAHLVESYKGEQQRVSILDFANYITFFPQIASGPISRPQDFYADLNAQEKYQYSISAVGLSITSGVFKKYVLASYLFTIVSRPFSTPTGFNSLELLVAVLAYACLIFVDFSGYSDLANGITMLLGFRPVPNFNRPYSASSLSEFWRKWHISLSNWLKDYLYIPMGGSKVIWYRKYFNLFMTMLLGGIWHGVGWQFILWGAVHGVGLWLSHYLQWLWGELQNWQAKVIRALGIFCTFSFVCLTWILFNSSSIEVAGQYIAHLFSFSSMNDLGEQGGGGVISELSLGVIAVVLGWQFVNPKIITWLEQTLDQYLVLTTIVLGGAMYLCLRLGPETVPPFIYFNF
ncbi:MAG: MBOAT family O-acyltransferase [Pseudanabaenaceae cyanobacterium]